MQALSRQEPPPLLTPFRGNTEKVAILLAALESSLAVNLLKRFSPEDVKRIMSSANQLGALKTNDVSPLVDEFAHEFSRALGISAGPEQLMALLESAFSADEVATFLGRKKAREQENVWDKLKSSTEQIVVPYLLDENEQVSAYILSKLPPELSARCMAKLPRDARNRIAMRLIRLSPVEPEIDELLQQAIGEDLFAKSSKADSDESTEMLAAVINQMERPVTEELLEELARTNPEEMKKIRKLIFMFEDIVHLEQRDRSKLFDRAATDVVIQALYGVSPEIKEVVLSSLSARSRRMVESELQGDTSVPTPATPGAQRKLADLALQMAKASEITLKAASAPEKPAADS